MTTTVQVTVSVAPVIGQPGDKPHTKVTVTRGEDGLVVLAIDDREAKMSDDEAVEVIHAIDMVREGEED